jgi:predicted neuraminidase
MLVRTTAGRIYRSDSTDGGRRWSTLAPTDLPNNNSGIDCARRDDGLLALVYNHVPDNWGRRSPLNVIFSTDDGSTWFEPLVLEHYEPTGEEEKQIKLDRAHRVNEFSYPAVVADGERFLIVYTWKRERIAYRELAVEL